MLIARSVASSSATATLLFARHRLAASRLRARGSGACAGNVVACMEVPGWEGPKGLLLVVVMLVVVVVWPLVKLLLLLSFLLLSPLVVATLIGAGAIGTGAIGTCGVANAADELVR